jgi:hypothetical protein
MTSATSLRPVLSWNLKRNLKMTYTERFDSNQLPYRHQIFRRKEEAWGKTKSRNNFRKWNASICLRMYFSLIWSHISSAFYKNQSSQISSFFLIYLLPSKLRCWLQKRNPWIFWQRYETYLIQKAQVALNSRSEVYYYEWSRVRHITMLPFGRHANTDHKPHKKEPPVSSCHRRHFIVITLLPCFWAAKCRR